MNVLLIFEEAICRSGPLCHMRITVIVGSVGLVPDPVNTSTAGESLAIYPPHLFRPRPAVRPSALDLKLHRVTLSDFLTCQVVPMHENVRTHGQRDKSVFEGIAKPLYDSRLYGALIHLTVRLVGSPSDAEAFSRRAG